jgi:hypothetical protein
MPSSNIVEFIVDGFGLQTMSVRHTVWNDLYAMKQTLTVLEWSKTHSECSKLMPVRWIQPSGWGP